VCPERTGYSAHEYADEHGDAHGNKSDGEGNPGALEHPGKHITPQIVGAEKVDPQGRNLSGSKGFDIRRGEGRPQFFLQPHHGRVKNRLCSRGEEKSHEGHAEEDQEYDKTRDGKAICHEEAVGFPEP